MIRGMRMTQLKTWMGAISEATRSGWSCRRVAGMEAVVAEVEEVVEWEEEEEEEWNCAATTSVECVIGEVRADTAMVVMSLAEAGIQDPPCAVTTATSSATLAGSVRLGEEEAGEWAVAADPDRPRLAGGDRPHDPGAGRRGDGAVCPGPHAEVDQYPKVLCEGVGPAPRSAAEVSRRNGVARPSEEVLRPNEGVSRQNEAAAPRIRSVSPRITWHDAIRAILIRTILMIP